MKKLTVGLMAHVDAGKTTLAESLLYTAGEIRTPGRVDRGDTVMDTHELERRRGITIFTGTAGLSWNGARLTLLDTPGHIDFSAEAERVMQVLDAALLVISGLDGVQAHTLTLWKLLDRYQVPVFLFVTKMDFARRSREELLEGLRGALSPQIIPFDEGEEALFDTAALCDEELLEEYTSTGRIRGEALRDRVRNRRIFPCFFGSGLRGDGVNLLLDALADFAETRDASGPAAARVFKISYDAQENRLTHVKLLRGALSVRDAVACGSEAGEEHSEKISRIRILRGGRFVQTDRIEAGDVACLLGLSESAAGGILRTGEGSSLSPAAKALLEPVMSYRIGLPDGDDPKTVLPKLARLAEEDPSLHIRWNDRLKEIEIDLMGEIQTEVIESLALERFGLRMNVEEGRVLYKETVVTAVEGVGHYEPLRHYAEVHLLIEPLPAGSGIELRSGVSADRLATNWQRLILTHLAEKTHPGVLTGAPLTDVRITLAAGRDHEKHTEGGDFRQATYRALRQGLMEAREAGACRLLEPFYAFRLELPAEQLGRAMTELRLRHAEMDAPETDGSVSRLSGKAPVASLNGYAQELRAYTGGRGQLFLEPAGYGPCHDAEDRIAAAGYDPRADLENTPDSVFCSHGAGRPVAWNEVRQYMHLPSVLKPEKPAADPARKPGSSAPVPIDDRELEEIMAREFGPIKRPLLTKTERALYRPDETPSADHVELYKNNFFLIDGYNLIFSWDELKATAADDLGLAREKLLTALANYQAFTGCKMAVIFDGYRLPGGEGERSDVGGVHVVFTKEHETADAYIERFVNELGKNERVRVVTSDGMIQLGALRAGVLRMSSREFRAEIGRVLKEIDLFLEKLANKP